MLSAGKSRSHLCIRLAMYQREQKKLVGVVAATVEEMSLSAQPPMLTETIFPPHSDWVTNYRSAYISVSVNLTFTSTKLPIEHVGTVGADSLCVTLSSLFLACSMAQNGNQRVEVK